MDQEMGGSWLIRRGYQVFCETIFESCLYYATIVFAGKNSDASGSYMIEVQKIIKGLNNLCKNKPVQFKIDQFF